MVLRERKSSMPLQRHSSVYNAYNEKPGSFEELEPSIESSTTTSSSSSWKLLRKLFKDSRTFSKELIESSAGGKKTRKHSCEQVSPVERTSPTGLRKLSAVAYKQRKNSSNKAPNIKSRKFLAVNSQENLLHYFVTEADTSTLQKILQNKKVNVNFMRPPGLSALHTACVLGDLQVVELLVNHGADINLKTWSGVSPLQITSLFGHFDVAQLLIKHGASSKDIQDGFSGDAKLIQTVLVCI